MDKINEVVSSLLLLADEQGYLLFDDILDLADENDLSVSEVDQISELIKLKGVLLFEERPHDISAKEYEDYSHIDYEDVYREVCAMSPDLKVLVDTIREIVPPQYGEIIALTNQIWNGNTYARERLINSQLRVALKLALAISKTNNYDLQDAVSAAFLGLVIATDKFDPHGFSTFQSYASWWIRTTISRECKPNWMEYYHPVYFKEKIIPIYEEFIEMQEYSSYDDDEIRNQISRKREMPIESVSYYIETAVQQKTGKLSLESLIENDSIVLYSEKFCTYDTHQTALSYLQNAIRHELASLKPREQEILIERFGLETGVGKTLEEIGKIHGITRERIRQIEKKALKKLSSQQVKERLYEYYYH